MKSPLAVSIFAILAAALLVGGVFAWQYRFDVQREIERAQLPQARDYQEYDDSTAAVPVAPPANTTEPAAPVVEPAPDLPPEANLAVPFTPQAPHANWDLPYQEFCEEASVLMAFEYVQGGAIAGPDDADAKMLQIKEFEERFFGEYKDTDVVQTAAILTEYFDYDAVQVVADPTANQIRAAVAAGKPVIVPAAGRELNNQYFQQPGPLYHMIVVKGYTADGRFIVNDPGTRRGADFLYDEATLMNAMHDWRDDRNITAGRKAIIIVG